MDKKWLAIGFVFICLVLMGAIWGSCWQYRQTEIDNLKFQVVARDSEVKSWRSAYEALGTELQESRARYADLQQYYFDLLNYSSNQTTAMADLYDKYQKLLENPITIEKPFYVPSPNNRHFTSLAELAQWIKQDKTNEMEYTGQNANGIDCDNFAFILQANADRAGFLISSQYKDNHLFNTVLIGNVLYGIEPQTDRIWVVINLD